MNAFVTYASITFLNGLRQRENATIIQDSLFELLSNNAGDDDLVRYGCDAIANLAFAAQSQVAATQSATSVVVVFSNDAQCECLCEFLPASAEAARPKSSGKDEPWDPEPEALGLPAHVVVAIAALARQQQNQMALQRHQTLLSRLAHFINARLDDVAKTASAKLERQQDAREENDEEEQTAEDNEETRRPSTAAVEKTHGPAVHAVTFACRLLGALSCGTEAKASAVRSGGLVLSALIRCVGGNGSAAGQTNREALILAAVQALAYLSRLEELRNESMWSTDTSWYAVITEPLEAGRSAIQAMTKQIMESADLKKAEKTTKLVAAANTSRLAAATAASELLCSLCVLPLNLAAIATAVHAAEMGEELASGAQLMLRAFLSFAVCVLPLGGTDSNPVVETSEREPKKKWTSRLLLKKEGPDAAQAREVLDILLEDTLLRMQIAVGGALFNLTSGGNGAICRFLLGTSDPDLVATDAMLAAGDPDGSVGINAERERLLASIAATLWAGDNCDVTVQQFSAGCLSNMVAVLSTSDSAGQVPRLLLGTTGPKLIHGLMHCIGQATDAPKTSQEYCIGALSKLMWLPSVRAMAMNYSKHEGENAQSDQIKNNPSDCVALLLSLLNGEHEERTFRVLSMLHKVAEDVHCIGGLVHVDDDGVEHGEAWLTRNTAKLEVARKTEVLLTIGKHEGCWFKLFETLKSLQSKWSQRSKALLTSNSGDAHIAESLSVLVGAREQMLALLWSLFGEDYNRRCCCETPGFVEALFSLAREAADGAILLSWQGRFGLGSTLKLAGVLAELSMDPAVALEMTHEQKGLLNVLADLLQFRLGHEFVGSADEAVTVRAVRHLAQLCLRRLSLYIADDSFINTRVSVAKITTHDVKGT